MTTAASRVTGASAARSAEGAGAHRVDGLHAQHVLAAHALSDLEGRGVVPDIEVGLDIHHETLRVLPQRERPRPCAPQDFRRVMVHQRPHVEGFT